MAELGDILKEIKSRGLFGSIKRIRYNYDIEKAMEVVKQIGKARSPRFAIDEANRFAYENFVKWVMGDPTMQALDPETKRPTQGRLTAGIYVAGNTGTGKSWLLEIMSAFCLIDEPHVTFGDNTRPLRWVNYRADAICDEYTAKGDISRFKTMAVVGIQDFGSEPPECMYMGNRMAVLGSIIESRGDRTDQITMITSNYPCSHKRVREIYGDRVASRLMQMCNYLEIRGADRRRV